jgi:hypothetical protein
LNGHNFRCSEWKYFFWDPWNNRRHKTFCQLAPYSSTEQKVHVGCARIPNPSKVRNNSWQHAGMSVDKSTTFLYRQTDLIMFFVQIQISERQASRLHVYTDEKRDQ